MKKINQLLFLVIIGSFVVLSACTKDNKDTVVSKKGLELSTAQEVPNTASKAFGSMDVSYDKSSKKLSFDISWTNLAATPTGSHIHGTAKRGMNAPIKYDFFSLLPKVVSGTFSNSVIVDGVAIKEDSLLMGYYYLNIHSSTYPGGEIRGQIEFK